MSTSIYPLEFDRAGFLLLTAEEWRNLHRDFKGKIKGQKTAMVYIPNQGTGLVFVKIVRSKASSERNNPMAKKKRRSTPRFRDVVGRFTSRRHKAVKRRRTKSRRTTKTASYNRKASRSMPSRYTPSRSGTSSTRLLTILGVGAAAIMLTKRLTAPKAQTPAQAAQPRKLSAPTTYAVRPAVGPTLPDGTII